MFTNSSVGYGAAIAASGANGGGGGGGGGGFYYYYSFSHPSFQKVMYTLS